MSPRRISHNDLQPDLLGGDSTAPAEIHRLFFALLPSADVGARIEQVAQSVATQQHLRARMIRPSRFHMTLHFLGDHSMLREDLANAAIVAAGRVRSGSFGLVLDSASGFHGREPPCVLRCSQLPPALDGLWQGLRRELTLAGLSGHLSRQFTPHVTFAYSRAGLLEPLPIEPITWQVERFALLHSVVGGGEYRVLGTWPLLLE
jgi:2'-5' RNA ligase